jgi:hypothetical protein
MQVYALWDGDPYYVFDVPGFFMGCFRLDALLNSTLECFYNQTCVDRIKAEVLLPGMELNVTVLNAARNLPNETIDSVVRKLFVHKWSQKISFPNYFAVCAPQLCTYEYIGGQSLISLVTSSISLLGGLSTVFEIVCVVLLWLMKKVKYSLIAFILLRISVEGQSVLKKNYETFFLYRVFLDQMPKSR